MAYPSGTDAPGRLVSHKHLGSETIVKTRTFDKRVLLLAAHLPDGGINTHMLTLGTALKRSGWEVALGSGGPLVDGVPSDAGTGIKRDGFPPLAEDYERAGIAHFEVSIPNRPRRLRDLPQLLRFPLATSQVIRAVRRFRPSVLHIHTRQMGTYARVVQALMGVPFVSTMHNPVHARSRLFAKTTFLGSMAVAVSNEIEGILISEYGVDPDRVRVVLPGSDAEYFRPPTLEERRLAREHFAIERDQFVLAFIGSLITRKRPDTLIEAVADLVGSGRNVVALLAGRGAEEEALRTQATKLGIVTRVRFLGHHDARDVLWSSDALALPSESEGFGMVLAEAMLCGVVVLRTPSGGADQFRPDVTGVVFEIGDHEELARRIADLIDRHDFREEMASHALEDARDRFSSSRMARTVEEIYTDVMKDRH